MKVLVKQQVPPGSYAATFMGVESATHEQYGDGLRWGWKIASGPQQGQEVFRSTKTTATVRNSCGKFLMSVTGKGLDAAMHEDLDKFRGKLYHIVVGMGEGGSTRVEAVAGSNGTPPAEFQSATAPAAVSAEFNDRF